jgi:hypothetical protein
VRRIFEPDSPRFTRRLETLAALRAAGVRTQAAVSPLLPGDVHALARGLEPVVDRVVLDDFFRGDGAGGQRSRVALDRLRALGHGSFAEPGYAAEAEQVFRSVLGSERLGVSQAGFNDLSWLAWEARASAVPR